MDIRRLPFSSFGKKNLLIRVFGTFTFMIQCAVAGAFHAANISGIFFSTSPPLIGAVACMAQMFRRVPIAYWAMDLNPDQLIAMGKINATSLTARLPGADEPFHPASAAALIIALDRFMAERLLKSAGFEAKMLGHAALAA